MPNYSDWVNLKEDDIWVSGCGNSTECVAWPGQTLGGTLPLPLVEMSGTSVVFPMALDKVVYSSKLVEFAWAYTACKTAGNDIPAGTRITALSGAIAFTDQIPTCPEVKRISHNGTLSLDSTFSIGVALISPWRGSAKGSGQLFIGDFLLQLDPLEPTGALSASATTAIIAAITLPEISSGILTISRPATPTIEHTTFSFDPDLPTSSPNSTSLTSSAVVALPTGGLIKGQDSRTGVIAGTISGVCVLVILVAVGWWWRRHPTKSQIEPYEMEENSNEVELVRPRESLGSHAMNSQWEIRQGRTVLHPSRKRRPTSLIASAGYNPALHHAAGLTYYDHSSVETSEHERIPGGPLTIPQSPTVSQEPLSPASIGPLPAYETYMDAPLVTFRRIGTRRPQGFETQELNEVETGDVLDILHRWAEERRDLIPQHFERRLRSGGYDPGMNPDEIPPQLWMERFGVTRYELAALRDAYGR